MKKKLLILAILIILFGAFIAFRFFSLSSKAGEGKLKILSSPSASVFLNNVAIGKTPFDEKFIEGEHILKLIPEGTATDTASWQGKIKINKNTLTFVDRELGTSDFSSSGIIFSIAKMASKPKNPNFGEIEVETEPNGAIVYLDNDEKGIAPLIMADVEMGDHEISIYSPGFFRKTQKINVESGYRLFANFKLAIDPGYKKIDKLETLEKKATESAEIKKTFMAIIKDTPTGWLRVRHEPTVNASESARVNPGDEFKIIEEKNGWYKIKFEANREGWISAQYSDKKETSNQ